MAAGIGSIRRRAMIVAVGVLLLLGGCAGSGEGPAQTGDVSGPEQPTKEEPQYGGVLRLAQRRPEAPYGVPWEASNFSPAIAFPAVEPLLRMDSRGKVYPHLAERWEVDPERAEVILYLRRGVQFHDGTPFNAEAVVYNLQQQINAKRISTFTEVTAVDEYTVRIRLKGWDNTAMLLLAGTQSLQISPTAVKEKGIDWVRWHPVGTGAFKLVKSDRNKEVVYEKNENYWDQGKPYLDGVHYIFFADEQTQKFALMGGEIDYLNSYSPEVIRDLRDAGFLVRLSPGGAFTGIFPDSANPDSPFADRRVREAVWLGIDRKAIADARGFGTWAPMNQLAYPNTDAFLEEYADPTYDPERAKELLAEAGYPNGLETKLIADSAREDRDAMVAVQRYLNQIGIRAELQMVEPARRTDYQVNGWSGLLVSGVGYFANYNAIIDFMLFNTNQGFVSLRRPDRLAELLAESRQTLEPEKEKLQAINRLLVEDRTVIPLYSYGGAHITPKNIHTTHGNWHVGFWWTPEDAWIGKEN